MENCKILNRRHVYSFRYPKINQRLSLDIGLGAIIIIIKCKKHCVVDDKTGSHNYWVQITLFYAAFSQICQQTN